MRDFYDLAPVLYDRGWRSIVPIWFCQKRPAIPAWNELADRSAMQEEIEQWRLQNGGGGVGLVFGNDPVIGIDLDWSDEATAREAYATTTTLLGPTPLVRVGDWPKTFLFYAVAPDFHEPTTRHEGFETYTYGGQCVLFGRHPRGFDYTWPKKSPLEISPHELPVVDSPKLCTLRATLLKLPPPPSKARDPTRSPATVRRLVVPRRQGMSSDQTSGALATFAPILRDVPDGERIDLAAEHIATAVQGTRYWTMSGVIFALVKLGAEDEEIMRLLPVYLDHFDAADIKTRAVGFEGGLAWARRTYGPSRSQVLTDPLIARLRAGWQARRITPQHRKTPAWTGKRRTSTEG